MTIKINNLKIIITFPFIALFTIIVISNRLHNYVFCLLSILVHESGHLMGMCIFKSLPKVVSISAFDIKLIETNRSYLTVNKDILITILGPFTNIITFLLFYFINTTYSYINLFVGLFNLLPSKSLDGGQLLYLILSKFINESKVKLIIDILTILFSAPLFLVGIFILLKSKYNFSLLFICIYLILSIFYKDDKYL